MIICMGSGCVKHWEEIKTEADLPSTCRLFFAQITDRSRQEFPTEKHAAPQDDQNDNDLAECLLVEATDQQTCGPESDEQSRERHQGNRVLNAGGFVIRHPRNPSSPRRRGSRPPSTLAPRTGGATLTPELMTLAPCLLLQDVCSIDIRICVRVKSGILSLWETSPS